MTDGDNCDLISDWRKLRTLHQPLWESQYCPKIFSFVASDTSCSDEFEKVKRTYLQKDIQSVLFHIERILYILQSNLDSIDSELIGNLNSHFKQLTLLILILLGSMRSMEHEIADYQSVMGKLVPLRDMLIAVRTSQLNAARESQKDAVRETQSGCQMGQCQVQGCGNLPTSRVTDLERQHEQKRDMSVDAFENAFQERKC